MKMNAMLMDYDNWINKKPGYTRSTMSRKKYSVQMKAFSENVLRLTNFKVSIRNFSTKKEYLRAKAVQSKAWRDNVLKSINP